MDIYIVFKLNLVYIYVGTMWKSNQIILFYFLLYFFWQPYKPGFWRLTKCTMGYCFKVVYRPGFLRSHLIDNIFYRISWRYFSNQVQNIPCYNYLMGKTGEFGNWVVRNVPNWYWISIVEPKFGITVMHFYLHY